MNIYVHICTSMRDTDIFTWCARSFPCHMPFPVPKLAFYLYGLNTMTILSVCESVCVSMCLPVCLPFCLPVYLSESFCLPVCLHVSVCLWDLEISVSIRPVFRRVVGGESQVFTAWEVIFMFVTFVTFVTNTQLMVITYECVRYIRYIRNEHITILKERIRNLSTRVSQLMVITYECVRYIRYIRNEHIRMLSRYIRNEHIRMLSP